MANNLWTQTKIKMNDVILRPEMQLEFLREQGAQSARIVNLEQDIHDMKRNLDEILKFVNETRGGHRFLWGVLTVASSLGAIIGSALTYWKFG